MCLPRTPHTMISQLIKSFQSVTSRENCFTAKTLDSCWLFSMMGGKVTVDLSKRGYKVAVMAVEHRVILDSMCLKMVLKVGSLSHYLEADGTLVTGVILEGFSSHPNLVGHVNNSLGDSAYRRLRVGCLGNCH